MNNSAGAVILTALEGLQPTSRELAFFRQSQPAGLTLFGRNIPAPFTLLSELTASVQNLSANLPLLVAIDQEGGRVSRIKAPFPNLGPAMSLSEGNSDAAALTEISDYALIVGSTLLNLGINLNFAPVCDVLTNPDNKAIGDRCFATTPREAGLRANAFLQGLTRSGVLGCLKHFPGQGDARTDTHHQLCNIELSAEELWIRELLPFRMAIKDAPMVMLSHCVYDAWDSVPASQSSRIVRELLQQKMGFQGVVVSDDMLMKAIPQSEQEWKQTLVKAIAAGVDLLLVCEHIEKSEMAIAALTEAAKSDTAFAGRLDAAAKKVNELRSQLA